jgi:hypothetical protein
MNTVTIPAYAADTLNETITLHAPDDWHDRIRQLSKRCCYGPNYRRAVLDSLRSMSDRCERGYSVVAYDDLLAAEQAAARADKDKW